MSNEKDEILDLGDLDNTVRPTKIIDNTGAYSEAEIEKELKGLDALANMVIEDNDTSALARKIARLVNQLELAAASAKDVEDPIVKWLIQSALVRLRK